MGTVNLDISGNTALLSIFNVGADWEAFSKELQEFFEKNPVGEDRQVAILLTCISEGVHSILTNLCHPVRPITKTLAELVTLLDGEFKPPKVSTYRKHIEFDRLRQNEEEVNEWYLKVKQVASKCEFGQYLDFRIKDKFVTGMKPGAVLDRLCEEQTSVILSELLEIALLTEATLSETIQEDIDVKIETEDIEEFNLADLHHSIDIKEDIPSEKLLPCTIHVKQKPFKCKICDKKFTEKKGLVNHTKNIHNKDRKPFKCKYCDDKLATRLDLSKHLITHTGERPFACEFCDYTFARKVYLQSHMRTHTGEKPFSSHLCNKKFAHEISCQLTNYPQIKMEEMEIKEEQLHHSIDIKEDPSVLESLPEGECEQETIVKPLPCEQNATSKPHTEEKPFMCEFCGYITSHLSVLKTHLRTHTGEKPFTCEFCGFKTAHSQILKIHRRIHTGEKPFACTICDYRAAKITSLRNHARTHSGEKPYQCDLCDYKFSQKPSLNKHLRIHTGEKPFTCEICDCKFRSKPNLNVHSKIHFEGKFAMTKKFICEICKHAFTEKASLKRHLKIHTGEKPFSCDICEYTCGEKSTLIQHFRIHTGERPFTCNICKNKFSTKGSLKNHSRTHTGDKPFKCEYCKYRSSQVGNLKNHKLKVHGGNK